MSVEIGELEERILKRMVKLGVFRSPSEALRAAILKYASELGLFDRKTVWEEITSFKRREVSPDHLKEDLERLEDET